MKSLLFTTLLCNFVSINQVLSSLSGEMILKSDYVGSTTYHLHRRQSKYKWDEAMLSCSRRNATIAYSPIPPFIKSDFAYIVGEEDFNLNVWITDTSKRECLTLKKNCITPQLLITGEALCTSVVFEPEPTDCGSSKTFLICQTIPATTTTSSTTTSTSVSTASVRRITTSMRPTVEKTEIPIQISLRTATDIFKIVTRARKDKTSSRFRENIIQGFTSFFVAFIGVPKDLLGLIVAVVSGVFLISGLCFIICCACQYKSERRRHKKYELVHGFSNNNVGRNGHKTDSTEETSLEDNNSDVQGHHEKLVVEGKDSPGTVGYPSLIPPPPPLVHHSISATNVQDRSHDTLDSLYYKRYHTMQGYYANAVDNNVYASISRMKKPSKNYPPEDLIIPPPPCPPPESLLPPLNPTPPIDFSDDEVLSSKYSQSSLQRTTKSATLTSNKSRHSRRVVYPSNNGGRKSKMTKNSNRSLDLLSTNL